MDWRCDDGSAIDLLDDEEKDDKKKYDVQEAATKMSHQSDEKTKKRKRTMDVACWIAAVGFDCIG